jgi:hypothetical protein
MAWPAHKEIGCSTPPPKSLRILNLLTYIILIFVNVASQTGLFGPDNATISRRFSTPLTPAGCDQALKCNFATPLEAAGRRQVQRKRAWTAC